VAAVTPPRPLAEADDRLSFDCGRETINAWFQRNAWANQVSGVSRTNVICEVATGDIVGFVSLSAGQIERAFLPKAFQRNKPDPVPITLLGQLAVRTDHQGRGYATSLLEFALRTAVHGSRYIGTFGVATHPLDDSLRSFYRRWGFADLPFDPRRAMIVRLADLAKLGIAM
jgi:GNAT superfamily N-acetyltransferase